MLQTTALVSWPMTASASGLRSEMRKSPALICGILCASSSSDELDVVEMERIGRQRVAMQEDGLIAAG
jgi:hypothetical protein